MRTLNPFILCMLTLAVSLAGCDQPANNDAGGGQSKHDEPPKAPTNRIDVPPSVRRNLGITFAKAELRHVRHTLRAPGRFELSPSAKRNYHTPLAGRVQLLVKQYDRVKPGDLLARVDSPNWIALQRKLSDTVTAIKQLDARIKTLDTRQRAIAKHESRLHDEESIWQARVKQIENLIQAGSGAATTLAEAQSMLATTRTNLAKVEEEKAELEQQRVDLTSQLTGYQSTTPLLFADALSQTVEADAVTLDLEMAQAASMTGLSITDLRKDTDQGPHFVPLWRTLRQIEIRAEREGVIEHLHVTPGQWADAGEHFITAIDPTALRFRAIGLQSELGRLRDGQPVRIVPPRGNEQSLTGFVEGKLLLGLEADPLQRKIDLLTRVDSAALTAWSRAGVAAEMEITTRQTDTPQLAIPVSAVIQDGLEKVMFHRDPKDPNKVIRVEADLGMSDGRWIVIESGLVPGDEVVVGGVYELMLAGGGRAKGGHFHADGTWHADDH